MEHNTDTSRRIAGVVERRISASGISLREAARQTGIPLTTLSRRLTGNSPFSLPELAAVAELLGVVASELVIEAETTDTRAAS